MAIDVVASVMIATSGSGRVCAFGVALAGSLPLPVDTFRDQLGMWLGQHPIEYGRFTFKWIPGRVDWAVVLHDGCDETELVDLLKSIATGLGIPIYINPSLPYEELVRLSADWRNFYFMVDPDIDPSSN